MAKKTELTQEQEILRLLSAEGFREVTPAELSTEPYKTLAQKPDCFGKERTVRHSS
jgi:hypothetical protein